MKLLKQIISVFIVFVLFIRFTGISQALVDKDSATTKVGNPPLNNDLVKAGLDIKLAYEKCNGGNTLENVGLDRCLSDSLLSSGYSATAITTFVARRSSTLYSQPPFLQPCTQCLGYVALVFALVTGSTDILTFGNAADVYPLSSFAAGGSIYSRINPNEPLLPGDVGAKGGGYGHIVIVNQPIGNIKFSAIESNGGLDCRITDTREINREPYNFFRKQ